jgi:hypothetical protein
MISAQDLLTHAEDLLAAGRRGAPLQMNLRRAISAAYYGVFHHLLADAADSLVGKTKRAEPGYGIVYRAFEHGRMRDRAGRAINLSDKIANRLGLAAFSNPVRNGATAFVALQAERHKADYDPHYRPSLDTARAQVEAARGAIANFSAADKAEYQLFLIMLLFEPRD